MESDSKKGKANPLCFHYPLWHKEKKKCPGCAVLNASVGYVIIIQAWDYYLNVQTCLDCLYELSNDYELDIHGWKLLVLQEKAVKLRQKLYLHIWMCFWTKKSDWQK